MNKLKMKIMKVIHENSELARFILAPGFAAIMLFGMVFARGTLSERSKRHEMIHVSQWLEVTILSVTLLAVAGLLAGAFWLVVLSPLVYYAWYVLEWLVKVFIPSSESAYRRVSLEREAYGNQDDIDYLEGRKFLAWVKHVLS